MFCFDFGVMAEKFVQYGHAREQLRDFSASEDEDVVDDGFYVPSSTVGTWHRALTMFKASFCHVCT